MNVLNLGKNLSDCPKPWQNMILELQQVLNTNFDVPDTAINAELEKFNANLEDYDDDTGDIFFDTEEDLLAYVLRWS